MNVYDFMKGFVIGAAVMFSYIIIGLLIVAAARAQDYPMVTPTYPSSGVYTTNDGVGVYTNGESVTTFGGTTYLGDRKTCSKIGNSFICN